MHNVAESLVDHVYPSSFVVTATSSSCQYQCTHDYLRISRNMKSAAGFVHTGGHGVGADAGYLCGLVTEC